MINTTCSDAWHGLAKQALLRPSAQLFVIKVSWSLCSTPSLRGIIFPEGHNTKPSMFLNEVKLTARHTRQRLVFCSSLCQKGLLGSAKLREFSLDKKAGASELQQVAPEASKPTLLGSPEVGLNMDGKTCLVSCQYCRVERRCSTSNSRFF